MVDQENSKTFFCLHHKYENENVMIQKMSYLIFQCVYPIIDCWWFRMQDAVRVRFFLALLTITFLLPKMKVSNLLWYFLIKMYFIVICFNKPEVLQSSQNIRPMVASCPTHFLQHSELGVNVWWAFIFVVPSTCTNHLR